MGYDTYLMVDGDIALMWRKHASFLPRLLFKHDQVVVSPSEHDPPLRDVRYVATVAEVLANLDDAGLGWHATVAAYSQTRIEGTSVGALMGHRMSAGDTERQIDRHVDEFRAMAPEQDLIALGRTLAHQWQDPETPEVLFFKDITYDGELPSPSQVGWEVFGVAATIDGVNEFAALRAAESMCVLYRDAPLLAWPMLVCLLLRHLAPDSEIVLDLSEDAQENGVRTEEEAFTYAADYWASASEGLTAFAQSLGRLFAVLASFDNKLGRDFWFARAAQLLGRLTDLAEAEDEVSTKARGDALEDLAEALLRTEEPELRVVEKNFRTTEEEIDILVTNGLKDPFWIAQSSPLIFIECKNWKDKPGVPELRVFESKIRDRGAICRIGIFISMSGFAGTFLTRLKTFQAEGGIIFAVDGQNLAELVASKTRLTEWLRADGVMKSLGR
ncbi:MAG: hypothetical protein QOH75_1348 [Actinomycetota bacterium]|nr:hypothetical protein [Actinomycetota bacterium]